MFIYNYNINEIACTIKDIQEVNTFWNVSRLKTLKDKETYIENYLEIGRTIDNGMICNRSVLYVIVSKQFDWKERRKKKTKTVRTCHPNGWQDSASRRSVAIG